MSRDERKKRGVDGVFDVEATKGIRALTLLDGAATAARWSPRPRRSQRHDAIRLPCEIIASCDLDYNKTHA